MLEECGLEYRVIPVNIGRGDQFKPEFLAISPNNRMPAIVDHDAPRDPGDGPVSVFESGAILLHLAERTPYLPDDQLERTRVHQWLFFEQSRIEAELAYARFLRLSGRHEQIPEVYENRLERGSDALAALERGLSDGREFVAGDGYTVADIALYAYVHCAGDAGADPREHAQISAWLDRVEAQPGFVNDLEPLPEHASARPV